MPTAPYRENYGHAWSHSLESHVTVHFPEYGRPRMHLQLSNVLLMRSADLSMANGIGQRLQGLSFKLVTDTGAA